MDRNGNPLRNAFVDTEGQYFLSLCYSLGRGVPKNDVEAASWLQKAALQGLPEANAALAHHYLTGRGVPKDNAKAVELFKVRL